MNEFEIISQFWHHTVSRADVKKGIGDDCAVVMPPKQQVLLITSDTLSEEVHFFKDTDPYQLGHKCLAVSMSDLAAMGAEPAWFLLNVTLPQVNEQWLAAFAKGMFSLAHKFNMQLIGGDTTRGPLSITIQAMGFAPQDQVIYRSGAQPGDFIYVTGKLGNAALAVKAFHQDFHLDKVEIAKVQSDLNSPTPRVQEGLLLRELASACIDISDGLAADLTHLLNASGVGAHIEVDKLPLSSILQKLPHDLALELALTGGDDYELLFTVPAAKQSLLEKMEKDFPSPLSLIGNIEASKDLKIFQRDQEITLSKLGYAHFE